MLGVPRKFLVHTVSQVSEWLGGDSVVELVGVKQKKKKTKLHFLKKMKWLHVLPSFTGKKSIQQRKTANWKTSYLKPTFNECAAQ